MQMYVSSRSSPPCDGCSSSPARRRARPNMHSHIENRAVACGARKNDLDGCEISSERSNSLSPSHAKRSKAGKQARRRGASEERAIKRQLQNEGFAAEKVS